MPPGLTIPTIFVAIDRFSAPMRIMRGAVSGFVAKSEIGLARVERSFRRILNPLTSFQNMMRGLGIYIGLFSAIMLIRSGVDIMADFEQAQVNISAVTGKAIGEHKALADQARVLGLRYGEAATKILELDLALIKAGYTQADVLKMSAPILTGSVALKATPEDLGKTVNSVLGAFKMPSSETQKVVDMMAKAADLSTMDWPDIQTMLPRAAQSAALAGMQFDELLSLFAAARNAQVHVASGSVAIKNMLISGAIHGKDFNEMLDKIIASPNKIKAAYKMLGQRTLVTALPLAEARKMGSTDHFLAMLRSQFDGYAQQVAEKRLDSIRGRITLFKRSWEELILSIDDGRGPVGAAIKQYMDIGSAMLLISADSQIAKDRVAQMDATVVAAAKKYLFWLKVVGYITAAFIALKLAMIAWSVAVMAGKIILGAYSVALAFAAAMGWANVAALRGNIIAITTLRGLIYLATAAQWLWNAAVTANPIVLAALAIAALAGYITMIIRKWDEWGAAGSIVLGTLGVMINLVMTLISHWDRIKQAFTSDGMIAGIRAIGLAIMDFVLYPVQQLYEALSVIPGLGKLGVTAQAIEKIRSNMLNSSPVNSGGGEESKREMVGPPSPKDTEESLKEMFSRISVEINNKTPFPTKVTSSGPAEVNWRPESTFNNF